MAGWGGLPLAPGEAVVWLQAAREVPPDARVALEALLDDEERTRATALLREGDREVFVRAHALLRAALSHHGAAPPSSWQLTRGRGKPELCGPLRGELRFNLSHSGGLVAVIVAAGTDVGVDVEEEGPRPRLEIARRFFAPSEIELLRAAPPEREADLFLTLWTLKEAFVKACGRRLLLPLDDFAFTVSDDAEGVRFSPPRSEREEDWFFRTWRPAAGHRASVAIRVGATRPQLCVRWLRAEEVLNGTEGTCGEQEADPPPPS
jgi:4'-phosphopantetheinyl transferase